MRVFETLLGAAGQYVCFKISCCGTSKMLAFGTDGDGRSIADKLGVVVLASSRRCTGDHDPVFLDKLCRTSIKSVSPADYLCKSDLCTGKHVGQHIDTFDCHTLRVTNSGQYIRDRKPRSVFCHLYIYTICDP